MKTYLDLAAIITKAQASYFCSIRVEIRHKRLLTESGPLLFSPPQPYSGFQKTIRQAGEQTRAKAPFGGWASGSLVRRFPTGGGLCACVSVWPPLLLPWLWPSLPGLSEQLVLRGLTLRKS